MTVTAIILCHYQERVGNIDRIVEDLKKSTVPPDKIIVFNDNSTVNYFSEGVTSINADSNFPVITRYALALTIDTDYFFFLYDDMTVTKDTLSNFILYAKKYPGHTLGYEGTKLVEGERPYFNGKYVKATNQPVNSDILTRLYFVPKHILSEVFIVREDNKDLPKENIDDIILSVSNRGNNLVIPSYEAEVIDLQDGGVGQCKTEQHYINRDIASSILFK